MGPETGVSCSRGGADRPVSSGGSSPPSCNLTWGWKTLRVCRRDPVCVEVDHLLKQGSRELFGPPFLQIYL